MDLRDVLLGIFWMVIGNLVFYLVYPLFTSFIDGFGSATMGTFGLTETIVAIGWGAYILLWIATGVILPVYLMIKGASKD